MSAFTQAGQNLRLTTSTLGNLNVNLAEGSISISADGSIVDGVDPTIKASVLSHPGHNNTLAVQLMDASGDPISGSAVTSIDGGIVTLGANADAAVLDATGTVNAHVRGIVKVLADSWDSGNHWQKVSIQNASLAITAAALPLPALAATSTKQSDGTQKTQIVDGSSNVIGATSNALDINIKSGNPTSITANPKATVSPATQNVTVQDTGSSVAAGANSQSLITGSPTAASTAPFALTSVETVRVMVSGTWTGTLQLEVSFDGGTTYLVNGAHQTGTAYTAATFTANFAALANVAGATHFRVRATAAITGTAVVTVTEAVASAITYLGNAVRVADATTPSQQLAIGSTGAAAANLTQINGVTLLAGNGATGTGSPRVTLANDTTWTGALNLGKAEDAAHGSGDVGVMALGVSNENSTAFSAASGDYTPIATNRYGMVYVGRAVPTRISSNVTPVTATVTTAVAAPSAGNHSRIVRFQFSNGGATACIVGLRDGAAGTVYYPTYLVQGAAISLNLALSGPLDLTTATRLDIYMSAAGSVNYTVDYLTVAD